RLGGRDRNSPDLRSVGLRTRGEITMDAAIATSDSKTMLWTGRILSALPALFLLLVGAMKLVKPEFGVKATVELGYPESVIPVLGMVLVACTVVYLIPQIAVLGAILLTGYLGGAVATHVRFGNELFPIIFPVIVGALLWGGPCLRDQRLRSIIFRRG